MVCPQWNAFWYPGPDNITNPLSFPSPFDGLYIHTARVVCVCAWWAVPQQEHNRYASSTKVGIFLNISSSRFLHTQWSISGGLYPMWSIAQLGMVPRNSFPKNNLCSTCNLKDTYTWFEFCPSFTIPSVHHLTVYPAFSRAQILNFAAYDQLCMVVGTNWNLQLLDILLMVYIYF